MILAIEGVWQFGGGYGIQVLTSSSQVVKWLACAYKCQCQHKRWYGYHGVSTEGFRDDLRRGSV